LGKFGGGCGGVFVGCLLATLEQLQRIKMRLGVKCVYVCELVCVCGWFLRLGLRHSSTTDLRLRVFLGPPPTGWLAAWQTRRILNSVYARTCRTLFLCPLCRLRCV